jgi:hypothetical protein
MKVMTSVFDEMGQLIKEVCQFSALAIAYAAVACHAECRFGVWGLLIYFVLCGRHENKKK